MASIITHSSHPEHQLRKMKLKYPFTCNLCNQPGSISCYRCTPCKFSIHESCAGVTAGGDTGLHGRAPLQQPGKVATEGTAGVASSGVGVPNSTEATTTRAKLFGAGAFGGAGIMGTVATIVVTGAGKSLVGKAMDSVLGRKKETTEEGSTEAEGSAIDETPDEMNEGDQDDYEGNGYDEQGDEDEGIDEDEPEEGYGEEQQQDEEEEEEQQQEEGYEGEQQDEEGNEEEQQQEGYEGEEQEVPTSTIEDTETTEDGFFSKVIEIATNGFTGNE